MNPLLPPVPLAAAALALGALGGVAGSQALRSDDRPQIAEPLPTAQAALVDDTGVVAPRDRHAHRKIRRAADGMFYVWAQVNGNPVRFLVDTGASVVVLTDTDARASGARTGDDGGQMVTANGRTAMTWTRLSDMTVGSVHATGLRAAVVRHGLSVSLLGADMLARMGPVRIEGNRMEIG